MNTHARARSITVLTCTILFLASAGSHADSVALPHADAPPVGFVTHFHMGHFEELAETSVTAELSDLIHWRMTDALDTENPRVEDMQVDFSNAEAWLPILRASGRQGFPIIDTAVHHSSIPWRQAMTRKAGQNLVAYDGAIRNFSSLHSPMFRESVFRYIEQMTGWFKQHDTEGRVRGYMDGAEWFYPGTLDYSPMALEAFRTWLRAKYDTLESLNMAWGSDFSEWSNVEPPRPFPVGGPHAAEPTFALNAGIDASYATERMPVEVGHRYEASAWLSGPGPAALLSTLQIAWFDAAGTLMRIDAATPEEQGAGQFRCRREVLVPPGAHFVELHCKLLASGEVTYRNPRMVEVASQRVVTHTNPKAWRHLPFRGESTGKAVQQEKDLLLSLSAEPVPLPFERVGVALEDWVVFSFEAMAAWLNDCAKHIKTNDPNRLVCSYVGFVFAQQAQWDFGMAEQRLDISLMNSPAIDVNGIQVCIAGDDYTWATHVVDTARKYGKPVWSTDLIDFPYGLYSGFEPIYRGTLACVQHGMTGILWYGWRGVPDYSYLERLATPDRERLIGDVKKAIDAVDGFAPQTNVAQLMPIQSYSLADEGGYKGDMIDNGGLYHLLLDAGFVPDILTPYELEHGAPKPLQDYDALFVSDCPVLPTAVHKQLADYAAGGGVIIGSGRSPAKDLHGRALTPALTGMKSVRWIPERLGRTYWGRLHREQVYGNTPPVLVESPDPARTPEARRALRKRVVDAAADLGVPRTVAFAEDHGDVHVVPFHNADTGEWLLFLVHKGPGRCHHANLRIDMDQPFTRGEAWTDFDKKHAVEIADNGTLRTPDFTHACIIRLRQ
jgi:glycosyl hydrolase family 42 (putative beta-galactosidase)